MGNHIINNINSNSNKKRPLQSQARHFSGRDVRQREHGDGTVYNITLSATEVVSVKAYEELWNKIKWSPREQIDFVVKFKKKDDDKNEERDKYEEGDKIEKQKHSPLDTRVLVISAKKKARGKGFTILPYGSCT